VAVGIADIMLVVVRDPFVAGRAGLDGCAVMGRRVARSFDASEG